MRAIVLAAVVIGGLATSADAGCFLFIFCAPHGHHHRHHHHHRGHRHWHAQRTIVKKIIIVRHQKERGPAIDPIPITPLK